MSKKAIIGILSVLAMVLVAGILILNRGSKSYDDFDASDRDIYKDVMEEYESQFENQVDSESDVNNRICEFLTSAGYNVETLTELRMYDSGYDTEPFDVYLVVINDDTIYIRYTSESVTIIDWN